VLLAFWSGEEIGLLGSAAFVRNPPIPIARVSAYLNFDMVGRMQNNRLIVQATGTSPAWPEILRESNTSSAFDLALQTSPYQPTDVASFDQANVPTLNFFTGAHADYHRPSDTADKINYADLDRLTAFAAVITTRIGSLDKPPAYVKVQEQAPTRGQRAGMRVFTGTIPDYASDTKGLLVGGVIGGGPADKAGLQKGDVIVEIAGQSIGNIYDYTYAIDTLTLGEPARVVYLRQGERRETVLTPVARDR
jgi:C-terminal processing protease CtpA/Prc